MQAVCIITPSGMKCLASPLKNHFAGEKKCRLAKADPERTDKMARIKRSLKSDGLKLSAGHQHVIATVIELMLAADVGARTSFTIVSVR